MKKFSRRQEKNSEFEQKLVDLARVARVVAGGKRFRFRACICIGDKKGKIGMGVAKGSDVSGAIAKATAQAKKNLINIPIIKGTIPYEVTGKYVGAKVFLKPAQKGTGIIAGGAIRSVLELAGIKNILSKMMGSNNKINNVTATINILKNIKSPEEIAQSRGKELKDLALYLVEEKKDLKKTEAKGVKSDIKNKTIKK